MDYLNSIMKNIDENSAQMVQELIRIKSTAGAAEGEVPFGADVRKAFLYVPEKGMEAGFRTADADHCGKHVEILGESDKVMGITDHLAAAFFAMKAVKESGAPVGDTVRLILEPGEETGWKEREYFISAAEHPDYGFTSGREFSVIHGEKGILVFSLAKKFGKTLEKGMELRSFTGGEAANMVPDYARAVVRDTSGGGYGTIRKAAEEFQQEKQVQIRCKGAGKSLEITTEGISAHGANPQEGLNAISLLMDFLGKISFVNEDINDFVEFYNAYIGYELDGSALGCCFQDEVSGKTVLNAGKIMMDSQAAALTLNVHYPVTKQEDAVYNGIREAAERFNLGIIKEKHEKPLCLLAFEGRFPGVQEPVCRENESVSVENPVKLAKIYGEAIYRLACSPENGAAANKNLTR